MLKILLFSPSGAGLHYFGPGTNAHRMYSLLSGQSGVSVSLAHGFKDQEDLSHFDEQYFISGYRKRDILSGIRFLWNCKKWIQRHAREFDIIHCLGLFHNTFLPAVWFEKSGVPVIIKVTVNMEKGLSQSSLPAKIAGLESYRKRNAGLITGYIAISRAIERMLISEGIPPQKIHSIPNGVDTNRFKPVEQAFKQKIRRELGLADKFTVIFTGSFSNRKNPYLAAEAFLGLSGRKDLQLLLVGPDRDGENQRDRIHELVRVNGLDNVILKDYTDDIERYYQASDLFILPSANEGLSNSMLEALSCGLPALVTRVSGSEDIIVDSVNGCFINTDADEIASAILGYLEDREKLRQQSNGARETVMRSYSSRMILQHHLDLFRQASNERGQGFANTAFR